MKPNFLYIGPDKSGSSWMFDYLSKHEECYIPSCKDIYFFDRFYHRGSHWYLSFFRKGAGKQAVGEICHDYLFSQDAINRIKVFFDEIKILTSLRNPV